MTRLVRAPGRGLTAGLAALVLTAACAGSASPTRAPTSGPTATAAALATAAPTARPAPTGTPAPTPTVAPTIGEPADDGARIIALDANPPLIRCTDTGCSDPVVVPGRRARDLTIDSPAVGTVKVRLLLPAHFDAQPATRWSVLYLFQGGDLPYTGWTEWNAVEAVTAKTDLLVVMPAIGDGSYTDWWNGGNGGPPMWETFHLVELRQLLERNWQAGDRRAVAGVSLGGFGAMEYATRRPDLFRYAASYSGGLNQQLGGQNQWGSSLLWGDPVAQADVWKAHDPTTNAAALRGMGLFVSYGNGKPGPLDNGKPSVWDPSGDIERLCEAASKVFLARLAELKIPVTVDAYGNGTHSVPYADRELQRSLPLILKALGE